MEAAQKQSADLASANKKKKEKKKKEKAKLSFALDGEEEEEVVTKSSDKKRSNEDSDGEYNRYGPGRWRNLVSYLAEVASAKKLKSMKNPAVDTSFLPDREREERERIEREELRKEWLARQDKMKRETIEITYSYWDGSGHRSSVEVSRHRCPFALISS